MTGGLVQIVTIGKQDIYLTINPEITFFKKVYRRHTNFSLELVEIYPDQTPNYNNNISFNLGIGDVVHRCYLEVDLPYLSFYDSNINNTTYINKKENDITNYEKEQIKWNNYYSNLKGFVDVESILYRSLYNLLETENIAINTLKYEVNQFNFNNKNDKDKYKNKIDEKVFFAINISGYISSINKLITNNTTYDSTIYITRTEIINKIDEMYASMVYNLKYYNHESNKYLLLIQEKQRTDIIDFNYAKFLGHNYFQNFTLQIGGLEIEKYSNEVLHINQLHHIKQDEIPNYYEMIGNTPNLTDFNNKPKGNQKILVPLIFWFNKDAGASLPLVALQYSSIIINAKINNLTNIVNFQNFDKMYYDILNYQSNTLALNTNLIYDSYQRNNIGIKYNCTIINDELLKLTFPDLLTNEINIILANGTENLIDKYQWTGFMLNIKNVIYKDLAPKVASYYPYVDINLFYSSIPEPKIKLICESVFLDDVERAKFANAKLEYVVEVHDENIFNINDITTNQSYDVELSFNNPCKELIWFVQPQLFIDGLTQFGQNISLLFDTSNYFTNKLFVNQTLSFNQLDALIKNVNINTDFNYYVNTLSYKYLNNTLPDGIFYHSFCLYPEETQPSGTINLRQVKGKLYHVNFNKKFIDEYIVILNKLYANYLPSLINNKKSFTLKFLSKNYDLFVVHKGQAHLLFFN
jgi:hypothetical protein